MPRGQRFPLEVMLRAMREVDNGVPVSVVCRKVGMVEKTFYRYREKYQGMEATEARRLRELEEENGRLKKLSKDSSNKGQAPSLVSIHPASSILAMEGSRRRSDSRTVSGRRFGRP